jgi:dTDP-glucose pyrophosphorylase
MSNTIVITMAGRGSRFYQAGYTVPKYQIAAHGHSLFYWSMLSLKNFIDADSRLVFVCLKENNSGAYVRSQCAELGFHDVAIFELETLTDGQATSAYLSRGLWRARGPVIIYNIDTYVEPDALRPTAIPAGADGWVPCFQVPGEHWSFVKLGDDGWATEVAEKRRISDYASIGLYWFADGADYIAAYDSYFADPAHLVGGERYVAPLYQQLLRDGKKVAIDDLPPAKVHVLGTPAELAVFLAAAPARL